MAETASKSQQQDQAGTAESNGVKIKKTRSPNYPSINLETAVSKTNTLYQAFRRHPMPQVKVMQKLGYKPDSSVGQQVIAALKAYGLVDITGTGKTRSVAISEPGEKIVRSHPDRPKLLQVAAFTPRIHMELLDKYYSGGKETPIDVVRNYLIWERAEGKFNEQVVNQFLAQFAETILFAKQNTSGIISSEQLKEADETPGNGTDETHDPKIPPKPKKETMTVNPGQIAASITLFGDGDFQVVAPEKITSANKLLVVPWLRRLLGQLTGGEIKENELDPSDGGTDE